MYTLFKYFSLVIISLLVVATALPVFAFETLAKQAIVVDYETGETLFEKNADELMHPSSMSKLMTAHIVFERLKQGSLKMTDEFTVSEKAWRMQGSKMFVELGAKITVKDLIQGVVVQSGNDACIVLAEGISGTEEAFAELMNKTAKELGMNNTHFVNSTGWPDDKHLTTARDLAKLAISTIRDFPEFYPTYSEKEFTYHKIKQGNRNLLLYRNIGVDGLKTGHTEIAGYGVVVSGKDASGRRVVLVVNGLSSQKERAEQSELLYNHGLRDFELKRIFKTGAVIEEAPVWFGTKKTVGLVAAEELKFNLPKADKAAIKIALRYDSPLPAPVKKGDKVGEIVVAIPGRAEVVVPALAADDVDKLGMMARFLPSLENRLFGKKGQ